jgi:hypothetical protein
MISFQAQCAGFRPSLRDLILFNRNPSVETLGYFQSSLRDDEDENLDGIGFGNLRDRSFAPLHQVHPEISKSTVS